MSSRPQTPNGPECFISICLHGRRHEWMTLFNTLGKDTRLSVWERSHTHSKSSGVRLFGQRRTGMLCITYLRVWRRACVYRASSVEMGMCEIMLVLHAAVIDVYSESDCPFKLLVQSAEQLSGLIYLSARCGEHLHGLSAPVCAGCNTQLSVRYAYCRWSDTLTNPVTLLFKHLIYVTIADQCKLEQKRPIQQNLQCASNN